MKLFHRQGCEGGRDVRGQGVPEYSLLLSVVALTVVGVLALLGPWMVSVYEALISIF